MDCQQPGGTSREFVEAEQVLRLGGGLAQDPEGAMKRSIFGVFQFDEVSSAPWCWPASASSSPR
ncbi:MAG: hypothetical protein U1E60_09110 [Reyranellaceae bacterium]